MLVGVVEGWPNEGRHGSVDDCEILGAVGLGAHDCVHQGSSVGHKRAAWLQDEGQAQVHNGVTDLLDQVSWGGDLVTPASSRTLTQVTHHMEYFEAE